MAILLTQTQLPQESILDLNGKQTYLGNSFLLPMPGISVANNTETPMVVITNPANSGKSLFIFNRKVSTDNNNATIRFYLNPTLNVHGTATAALNLRSGSTTASISVCYLSSTITSNGTLLSALPASAVVVNQDLFYVLDQGKSMLITAQQIGAGTSTIFSENAWYEI